MGGWQARTHYLAPKMIALKDDKVPFMTSLTDEELDAGFDFCLEGNVMTPVQQFKWVTKSIKNDTPIQNWPAQYIEKILAKMSTEGALCKKRFSIGFTLSDVEEWYTRDIIMKYWPQLKSKALIMLGEGNAGKTPIAEVVSQRHTPL